MVRVGAAIEAKMATWAGPRVETREKGQKMRVKRPLLLVGTLKELPTNSLSASFIKKFRRGLQQRRKPGAILTAKLALEKYN